MENKKISILIYSFCHFIVDFVCAIFILGQLPYIAQTNSEIFIAIIIYNFFAFAFQVPLGYILDKFKIYKYVAIIGFALIGICYTFILNNAYLIATIVGIGNALFHLEGGVNIYSISERKTFLNGLFVAPGALGIFLGTTFHNELITTYWPIILIFFSIFLLFLIQKQEIYTKLEKNMQNNLDKSNIALIIIRGILQIWLNIFRRNR